VATVVDASSLGDFLRGARRDLPEPPLHVPALCDLEVASHLRRLVLMERADPRLAAQLLGLYLSLPLTRHRHEPLLERVLELRDNFSAYDAAYVVLAERLGLPLLTGDERLGRAVREHVPAVPLI
jgi:predicted nucleic acid-binding protein